MLDSPHFTDLTKGVLVKRNAIVEAALASGEPMHDLIEIAFIAYVEERVLPIARLFAQWMDMQHASNVTSIPEHISGPTVEILGDVLYDNSLHAQKLLTGQHHSLAALRRAGSEEARIDAAQRQQAPPEIGALIQAHDGRAGTIEQITDDRVLLRLTTGEYIWIDRRPSW
jgi:hypothetical protein